MPASAQSTIRGEYGSIFDAYSISMIYRLRINVERMLSQALGDASNESSGAQARC
jgi:hypothetical protein